MGIFDPNHELFPWVTLPLIVFFARMCDVTLGTMRIILLHKGKKAPVVILGFFEVLIWITTISQVMKQLDNFACYLAWAGGFAMGNLVGMAIEERIALGTLVIRIITPQEPSELEDAMRGMNLGVTRIQGMGSTGPVSVIFAVVPRKTMPQVQGLIATHLPNAFYSIEDVRDSQSGIFPKKRAKQPFLTEGLRLRKGK